MSIIDFSEIPIKNSKKDLSDEFELFARDYLEMKGFTIINGPDRGPDLGRDLIVEEQLDGIIGNVKRRWLVSCKHFAHRGKAVGKSDEIDINDRVKSNNCDGFLGFYSTLPSSPLVKKLEGLKKVNFVIFDKEKISNDLCRSSDETNLFRRYFPKSYDKYNTQNPTPSNIFEKEFKLKCDNCGQDLHEIGNGVLAFGKKDDMIEDIYVACKGKCDRILQSKFSQRGLHDLWDELGNLKAPLGFLRWLLKTENHLLEMYSLDTKAREKLNYILISSFQQVSRDHTNDEIQKYGQPSSVNSVY